MMDDVRSRVIGRKMSVGALENVRRSCCDIYIPTLDKGSVSTWTSDFWEVKLRCQRFVKAAVQEKSPIIARC